MPPTILQAPADATASLVVCSQPNTEPEAIPGITKVESDPSLAIRTNSILHSYLSAANYSLDWPLPPYPQAIENTIRLFIPSWNLNSHHLKKLHKLLPIVCNGVSMAYPRASLPLLVYIGIYTVLFFMIDDMGQTDPARLLKAVQKCQPQWATGLSDVVDEDEEPVLANWIKHTIVETPKYFGSFATRSIIKATFDFLLGLTIEMRFPSGVGSATAAGEKFPRFLRVKTGVAEPFAHFIFPEESFPEDQFLGKYYAAVPEMIDFIHYTNDVLSFYKEMVAVGGEEKGTYLELQAAAWGVDLAVALQRTCTENLESIGNVTKVLEVDNRLKQAWIEFVYGYTMYHISQERYRLKELGIGHWRAASDARQETV